ncbi:CPBP family intramembrane glutamic endopeptidase [Clostridium perfringens]
MNYKLKSTLDIIKVCICEIMLMISFTFIFYFIKSYFYTNDVLNMFFWILKEILVYVILMWLFKIKILNYFKIKTKFNIKMIMISLTILYLIIELILFNVLPTIPNYSIYVFIDSIFGGKGIKGVYLLTYVFIVTVIIAPILEEVVYRGYILGNLLKVYNKPIIPIVISALAFGLIHLGTQSSINGFIFGLVSGYIYYKYSNLKYNVLLHSSINLVTYMSLIIKLF